jgi:hypothetical protein
MGKFVVFKEDHDAMVKRQFIESETTYDQKGNVVEEINYKPGRIDKHFKNQYYSYNNKLSFFNKFKSSAELNLHLKIVL